LACSTDGFAFTLPVEPDLPDPVDQMRRDIATAAMGCDIDGLAALAAPDFEHTFDPNAPADPADFWADREAAGAGLLRRLVELLAIPVGTRPADDGGLEFVWPGAAAYDSWSEAPEADRAALADLFTPEDLEAFAADDLYLGGRVIITTDGSWVVYQPGEGS
jgi:hypothetical protein